MPLSAWAQKQFPVDSSQIKIIDLKKEEGKPIEDIVTFLRRANSPVAVKSLSPGKVIAVNVIKDTTWVITIKDMQKQYIYHGVGTTGLKQGDSIRRGTVIGKLTPVNDTVAVDFAMVQHRKSLTRKQLLKYFGK